ncbi:MAG: hypothetical protein ACTSVM_00150 [Candidatus Ranarchaeia archaeon]
MQLPIGFEFHSYNVFITVVLLGIIPVCYVIDLWRKVRHEIIFEAFLGPLVAIEYLLAGFWFILTFPFWVFVEATTYLQTGLLLIDGLWGLHGIVYILFFISFPVIPNWIRANVEKFAEMYGELKDKEKQQYNLDTRRLLSQRKSARTTNGEQENKNNKAG